MVSLRPSGLHGGMRAAAARHGARVVALSPWSLRTCDTPAARTALRAALGAGHVVFTSPAAVRAATALDALPCGLRRQFFAVGTGTAAALRRAGAERIAVPARMDSEGLLALPGLRGIRGSHVGLVTAPGGRDRIAAVLRKRGARVLRADVYVRVPIDPAPRALDAVRGLPDCSWLAVTSAQALARVLDGVPADVRTRLRRMATVVASARLADHARALGLRGRIVVAAGPRPAQLFAAATTGRLR